MPERAGTLQGPLSALTLPPWGNLSTCWDFHWALGQFRKIFEGHWITKAQWSISATHCHQHADDCFWVCHLSFFFIWGGVYLGSMGSFSSCVTPCSYCPYPSCPNWTTLVTNWKEPLLNQAGACLLREQDVGLAKQGRVYPQCLVMGGKNNTLSCCSFPSCWVVSACWQHLMSFPAWGEQFLLQFQNIFFSLLFLLLVLDLPCLGVSHNEALIITALKWNFLLWYIAQWCGYEIPLFGSILVSYLGCSDDFEAESVKEKGFQMWRTGLDFLGLKYMLNIEYISYSLWEYSGDNIHIF